MSESKRFNLIMSDKAYKDLEELARRKGKPMSDVIRDALALEMWLDETQREGGRILVERGGKAREVIKR
jgi:hypothetical protein